MPNVGTVWFIGDGAETHLITNMTPIDQAELYGDFLTHAASHYAFWTYLQTLTPAHLRRRLGTTAPNHAEYEDWPRGRIVLHRPSRQFTLYADRQLHQPHFIAQITAAFELTTANVQLRADEHYSRTWRLPPLSRG